MMHLKLPNIEMLQIHLLRYLIPYLPYYHVYSQVDHRLSLLLESTIAPHTPAQSIPNLLESSTIYNLHLIRGSNLMVPWLLGLLTF